jgi:hypothetical protein
LEVENSEGKVKHYKARFCAKGFTLVAGFDFNETYAPVAKMNSIRPIFSMTITDDLKLQQADVDISFSVWRYRYRYRFETAHWIC